VAPSVMALVVLNIINWIDAVSADRGVPIIRV
jgi:hypothetical protein